MREVRTNVNVRVNTWERIVSYIKNIIKIYRVQGHKHGTPDQGITRKWIDQLPDRQPIYTKVSWIDRENKSTILVTTD